MSRLRSAIGAMLMLLALPLAIVLAAWDRLAAWREAWAVRRRAARMKRTMQQLHKLVNAQRINALHGVDKEIPLDKDRRGRH